MSLRLEMLQVARLAPKVLDDSAELIHQFVLRQQNPDGGFKDRTGASDLYYTAFALDALTALQFDLTSIRVHPFLRLFGCGGDLDFVHLCCLARCWSALANPTDCEFAEIADGIALRLESFRASDGGFHTKPAENSGTAYAAFLALGAWQDLHLRMEGTGNLAESVQKLLRPDGGFCNTVEAPASSTNPTAAAVTLLRNLGQPVDPATGAWLLARAHSEGGFLASPSAPMPDLLSTATALHALSALECDFADVKETSLDFIDTLWTNEGSFFGHWGEDILDTEYTFYALLALGHLSY